MDGNSIPTYGKKPNEWKPSGKRTKGGLCRFTAKLGGNLNHYNLHSALQIEYRDLGSKEEGSYYLGEKEEGRSNASHEVKTAIIYRV
ncbi:hypothetical protein AFK68_26050 [Hydrocoleum sp. CS-953]|uniref:hypothetical protein n=1 Tax=Hydrocoleum sp. CS-953 TaxID=1671698 RepID=UPI000B9A21F3|nr:hypothetical protein [Hydrocoleum sp. CS-953]OZH52180.1 hypothetical protein AFK68_26050 [Hydrocoleum sp. CS-953]